MSLFDKAVRFYFSGDINSAKAILIEYVKDNPLDSEGYYYLGLIYSDTGRVKDAANNFSKALDIEDKGIYNYHLGDLYGQMLSFPQAIYHLEKAIKQTPENIRAMFVLGNIYFKYGDLDNAINCYTRIIAQSPNFAPAYYELGNALYYKGDLEGAALNYRNSLDITENPDILFKLGLVYIDLRDYSLSCNYFIESLNHGYSNMALLEANMGKVSKCFFECGMLKEALAIRFPKLEI